MQFLATVFGFGTLGGSLGLGLFLRTTSPSIFLCFFETGFLIGRGLGGLFRCLALAFFGT